MSRRTAGLICILLLVLSSLSFAKKRPAAEAQPDTKSHTCSDVDGHPEACPDVPAETASQPQSDSLKLRDVPRDLLQQQKSFWTSPARIRERDLKWLAPFTLATGGLIAADQSIEKKLPNSPSTISRSNTLSNAGVAAFAGVTGGMYLWGQMTDDQQMRETGILSGEAVANSMLLTTVFKYAAGRDRPLDGDHKGQFWNGGVSFPSEHAAIAWSVASVVAHKYPGPLTQALAYGLASAVTATRVTGRDHFASDAFVGSALGWYMGRQVVRAHEPADDTARWGTFDRGREETTREPRNMGSTWVPLDSWVYAAFDRLAALGYAPTGFAGLRPWTRLECVRLLDEAASELEDPDPDGGSDAGVLYRALREEFAVDAAFADSGRNRSAKIDSVYGRLTGIAGQPLNNGYLFGQTEVNDYGRPYAEGLNAVTGVSASATAGPFAVYVRGEYQHAPSASGLPDAVRFALPSSSLLFNHIPVPPGGPLATVNTLRLLDAYFVLAHDSWQFSVGKQSLWLGPGAGGPLIFSDNAEPIYMVRLSRVSPVKLPSIFGLLGPLRTEFFVGRLSGQHFVNTGGDMAVGNWDEPLDDQPFITGQKLSFKPTPNLEFGVSRTGLFGGPGFPVTFGRFRNVLFSGGNSFGNQDPGDRRSGFDFSYHIPKLRKYLVLYNDSMAEDEISPIGYPRRSAMNPGVYLPQLPGLRKVDFRAEAVYTDLPGLLYPGFFYFNVRYFDGYTNGGNLMGSWVGREGRGMQFQSTYWRSARTTFAVSYRNQAVSHELLEGGTLNDFGFRGDFKLRSDLQLRTGMQYERWDFPLLSSGRKSNLSSTVELTFRPQQRSR